MDTTSFAMPCVPRAAHIAGAVRLSNVEPQNIRWLWPGRIPLGRVTLLVSDPGLGKSLLTLDIAARVSTGSPWPDEPREEGRWGKGEGNSFSSDPPPSAFPLPPSCGRLPPSSVLLLTAEDDLADTVRPRLEALGADCEKILAIDTWGSFSETANSESRRIPATCDVPRTFALNRDLARLKNLLDAIPDCRLLIIDPVSAYLGGTNEHANADVQSLLTALATLARERNIAVIVVSHLRKKEGAAIYRTMGSLAFVAAARAAWVLCKDPSDPNNRLLLPLKNNLAPGITGLAFTIHPVAESLRDLDSNANAPPPNTPVIRWSPEPVNVSMESLMETTRRNGRPDHERQFAIDWLQDRLAHGPRAARDLKQEADVNGICSRTLRRAFRELAGEAIRRGPFPYGEWMWKLPGVDGQNPSGEFWPPTNFVDDFAELLNSWMPIARSPTTPNT